MGFLVDPLQTGQVASGDLSGTFPSPTVSKINGASVPVSKTVLGSNGSGQLIDATASLSAKSDKLIPITSANGDRLITSAELNGGIIEVEGASILTAIPCESGSSVLIVSKAAAAVSFKPDSGKQIRLNGTLLAADHKVTSTSISGDTLPIYYNGSEYVIPGSSNWSDGGL